MSDDRYNSPRNGSADHDRRDGFDDFEDDATAMVDLNSLEKSGGQNQRPQFGPPPNFSEDDGAASSEMFSIEEYADPNEGKASANVQMPGVGARGHHPPPPTTQKHEAISGSRQHSGPQHAPGSGYGQGGSSGGHQVVVGDASHSEGATQFLNISELAEGPRVAPDAQSSGYEGNTEFVNIAELQAGAPTQGGSIENDQMLRQSYQFNPENISQGEFTLIFAMNPMGRQVVLKRVWENDVASMPNELKQRVAALDPIRHPRLINFNGMLATTTGVWIEYNQPTGYRLTDILAQNGPQPVEQVVTWVQQAAEVLECVHGFQFVYANMTTDALWIQDDGSVLIEPFDVLTFENRGNLGPFGPPELNVPPEQRQVSPATDVYSLAAVTIAALTGLPLNLGAYETLDKKLRDATLQALSQDPMQRQSTPLEFATQCGKGSGGLPELNMKVVIGVAAILGFLLLGALYWQQEQAAAEKQRRVAAAQTQQAKQAQKAEKTEQNQAPATDEQETPGDDQPEAAVADAPGPVSPDPRLEISSSYTLNPELDAIEEEVATEDVAELRSKARSEVEGISRLTKKARQEKYEEALSLMAKVQRASPDGLNEDDRKFLSDLFQESDVKTLRKENLEAVLGALKSDKITSARLQYRHLERINADANAKSFFDRNKSAKITVLESDSKSAPKDD